jgi:hypothetical protein
VIPTVLVVGIVIGRWWAVPAAGLIWLSLLAATSSLGVSEVPIAVALAMANAAVGVAGRKVIALSLRHARRLLL